MPETKEISSPIEEAVESWERETLQPTLDAHPERKKRFESVSINEV